MESVSPRAIARDKLLEFYQNRVGTLGRKPKDDEFFPIALDELTQLLLPDWKIKERHDLYHISVDTPISGKADFDQKIIYLDTANVPRQRWTTAHELGHVFLEHGECPLRLDKDGIRSIMRPERLEPADGSVAKKEREANIFAVELLMPERTVMREFKKRFAADRLWVKSSQAQLILSTTYNIAADAAKKLATIRYPSYSSPLVDFFGVSPSTMYIRLLELGLVY
jgi:Zn-dependent peptidase ImmA (M78 family)